MVISTISPVDEMPTSVVGVALMGMLVVAFAEAGGISPEAPVDVSVYSVPEVEKTTIPEEKVVFGNSAEAELGGGMAPDPPVEVLTAVEPPTEIISTPEETVTVIFRPGVGVGRALLEIFEAGGGTTPDNVVVVVVVEASGGAVDELVSGNGLRGLSEFVPVEPVDDGGMIPCPPVEFAVKLLLPTVKFTLPSETVSTRVTGALGLGVGGGMMPSPPVEFAVMVLLATVKLTLPNETVSTIVTTDRLGVGGSSPLPPPLTVVAVDPETTIIVEPTDTISVLFNATEAGGTTPLPPVEK